MKKQYNEPAIEIVKFSFESILTQVKESGDPEQTLTEQGSEIPGNSEDPFGYQG